MKGDRPAAITGSREHWWADAVGYQVYLRSFADSNNDGVGDLGGLIAKLGYLESLGVDFVWITPFYPSPGDDWGYDVADYCDIDPLFGDLATFDRLLADAHERGMRIVTDLVPNHTSSRHRWFQAALGKTGESDREQYRDYYIWRDPAPGGGPPNNWVGYFGGPAWSLDADSGQYYLHLFLPSQPDLNWRNPAVSAEWDEILRFWLDRGVDGFRVDVAGGLVKDERLRSNPQLRPIPPGASRWEQWDCFEHLYDVFQPESQDVFRRWRTICDSYGAFLHGETYHLDPRGMDALLPPDGMHGGYWFAPMHIAWEPAQIRTTLRAPSADLAERLLWALSSHDMPRAPTRFELPGEPEASDGTINSPEQNSLKRKDPRRHPRTGSAQDLQLGERATPDSLGAARALAFNVLTAFLPGTFVLYQGEELGLTDGEVAVGDKLDPVGPSSDVGAGRDGCRTPMPWGTGAHNGFCDVDPWLRSVHRPYADTAAAQDSAERSWLRAYRELIGVLHRNRDHLEAEGTKVEWLDSGNGPIISYRRGRLVVTANVGETPCAMPIPADAKLLYDSASLSPHSSEASANAPDADLPPSPHLGHYLALPASAALWGTEAG